LRCHQSPANPEPELVEGGRTENEMERDATGNGEGEGRSRCEGVNEWSNDSAARLVGRGGASIDRLRDAASFIPYEEHGDSEYDTNRA
jgi:hypothetical protein